MTHEGQCKDVRSGEMTRLTKCTAWCSLSTLVLLVGMGCSMWTTAEVGGGSPKLPRPKMSRDSVGIQIATVTLNHAQGVALKEAIQELDEQVLPVALRRHLAENGIRAGRLDTQLPAAIRLLLLEAADRRERPTAEAYQQGLDQQRFVQCRSGKRYAASIWTTTGLLRIPHFDGDTRATAAYQDADLQMAIRCSAQGAEGAIIQLTPEVEHGRLKQTFVSEGSSFHLEGRRDRASFDDLTMEVILRPGETAMVTCTEGDAGFGQRFFRNVASTQQKILLVRLAQTQLEDLFAPRTDQRLATVEQ